MSQTLEQDHSSSNPASVILTQSLHRSVPWFLPVRLGDDNSSGLIEIFFLPGLNELIFVKNLPLDLQCTEHIQPVCTLCKRL